MSTPDNPMLTVPPAMPVVPPIAIPAAASPDYADKGTPAPKLHSRYSRWRIARAGGVGSACGMIMSEGLLGHDSIFHKPWTEVVPFLISVAVMVFVGFALVEPFLGWLEHGSFESHHHHKRSWLKRLGLLAIFILFSLLFTVFEDLHRETLIHRHMMMQWLIVMLVGWLVTYAWVLGAQQGVPRATLYGVIASLAVGVLSSGLIIFGALANMMFGEGSLSFNVAIQHLMPAIILLFFSNVCQWALLGLVGGLAIDFGRGIPVSLRILIALVVTATLTSFANPMIVDENSLIYADVFRLLGWGLALVIYPPAGLAFAEARIRKPAWWSTLLAVAFALCIACIISLSTWLTVYWQRDTFFGQVSGFGSHSAPVAVIVPIDDNILATSAFSRGGQTLDTTDLSIRLWNLTAAKEGIEEAEERRLFAYNMPLAADEERSPVARMQLSDLRSPHEHHRVWSASIDGTLTAWDTERCVPVFNEKFTLPNVPTEKLRDGAKQTLTTSAAQILFVRFRHDGRQIAVADDYGRLHLYNIEETFGEPRAVFTIKFESTLDIPGNGITAVRYNHEGNLAVLGTADGEVIVAELGSKEEVHTLHNTLMMPAERKRINEVAMSDDETLVAAAGDDGHIYVWNLKKNKMWPPLSGHDGPVTGVAFTPDGRHLASSALDGPTAFKLWDCLTNSEVFTGEQPGGASTVAIFADGSRAASGGPSGSVRVWRIPRF